MDKQKVIDALKELEGKSEKKKFQQNYDMVLVLQNLDLKKTDNQRDLYVTLHYNKGPKTRVAGLVGPELMDEAKKNFDTAVLSDNFKEFDKKKAKKLAETHDFIVAQANIMPQVAATFGKVLGPKGKMPNPKAGCVVPPKTAIKPLYEKLQKTIRVKIKSALMAQGTIGKEGQPQEEIVDNALTFYNQVVGQLPTHENNVRKVLIKMTMSPVVEIK